MGHPPTAATGASILSLSMDKQCVKMRLYNKTNDSGTTAALKGYHSTKRFAGGHCCHVTFTSSSTTVFLLPQQQLMFYCQHS